MVEWLKHRTSNTKVTVCCVLNACLLNHDVGNFLPVGFICLPDAETAAILWYDFGLQSYKNSAISGTITVFAARARQTIACVRGRKRTDICSFINDNDVDILLLTETWLRSAGDEAKCADLSPPGYSVHSFPRDRLRGPVRGGGIAIIVNNSLKHQVLSCSFSDLDHPSFEAAYIILNINRQRLNLFCAQHMVVREKIIDIMCRNHQAFSAYVDGDIGDYLAHNTIRPRSWGSDAEIFAAATLLQTTIVVYTATSKYSRTWLPHPPLFPINGVDRSEENIYLRNVCGHFERVVSTKVV
ncbi:hypothetical protein ACOMHN_014897 [Nucella lapillus]